MVDGILLLDLLQQLHMLATVLAVPRPHHHGNETSRDGGYTGSNRPRRNVITTAVPTGHQKRWSGTTIVAVAISIGGGGDEKGKWAQIFQSHNGWEKDKKRAVFHVFLNRHVSSIGSFVGVNDHLVIIVIHPKDQVCLHVVTRNRLGDLGITSA
jgi:hypothetical protein